MALAAAERIAESDGLRGLTARRTMRDIGYTIGTFYQLFESFDDLIVHLNGRTLDALRDACADPPLKGSPEDRLRALAQRYIRFTRKHTRRWGILFEHHLPDGERLPEWHFEKIGRLLGLIEAALAPLFATGQDAERHHSARVLWSSLHGICSLEATEKLVDTETVEAMTESLILNYLSGLRARGRKSNRKK
jgi:AcrR family transcriptional regulator